VRRGRAAWICLGALGACGMLAASAAAQPELTIEEKERIWDLAVDVPAGVAVGKTVEHEFLLLNSGTEALKITEAKAGDPYLTTQLPDEKIAPGKRGLLKAVFNAEGLEPGEIETHIVVKSTDPASATKPAVLTVKATVIPRAEALLVVKPQVRDIGLVRVGQPRSIICGYENAGSEAFEIYPLYYVDKRLRIVRDIEREVLKPGPPKEFELEFKALAEDAGREVDAVFVVKTGSEKQPRAVCRVRGYVAPAEEGVHIVPEYRSREGRYDFRIVNNTERAVEVVATRGETEIKRTVVQAESTQRFVSPAVTEEELKEISFQVNLDFVPAVPPPKDEGAEEATSPEAGESTETDTPEGGASEEADEPGDDAGAGGETETEAEPEGEGG